MPTSSALRCTVGSHRALDGLGSSVASVDDGYYEMHPRLMWVDIQSHSIVHASRIDSPLLASKLLPMKSVVSRVSSRSSCSTGECPFNYNLKHGANSADEYFSLSNEASSHVFQGESSYKNARVLRMTCIESGSYVLQFSSHYANVSNPLTIYGRYSMYDKTYSYADNGKEVRFSC